MKTKDLIESEFDSYYRRYVFKLADDIDLHEGFEIGSQKVQQFFQAIPKNKLTYRYAPEKWSIKEILQHLIDTERIFIYRCFRIARNDKTELAGFDQNIYIAPSGANDKSIDDLLNEFDVGRRNSIALLNSISDNDLCFVGDANGGAMSARAAAFTIIGHDIWHMEIIKERYL